MTSPALSEAGLKPRRAPSAAYAKGQSVFLMLVTSVRPNNPGPWQASTLKDTVTFC